MAIIAGLTSIIILTHNALSFTKECVQSVQKFTPENHELILIDNASTDRTPDYLRQVAGARVILNPKNLGYARGNNQGIASARGENILFLNNDTVVTASWLKKLLTCLNSDQRIGAVGPKTNALGNMRQVITPCPYGTMPEMHKFAARFGNNDPARWETMPWLSGFCLVTRRRVLDRVGYFDEQFGLGLCEDNDLCIRLGRAGYRLVCAGDTFVHHYRSVTFRSNKFDRSRMFHENLAKLRAKWPDTPVQSGPSLPKTIR